MSRERCAIYARVSTEDQARKFGLEAQLTELRAAAKQRGYALPRELEFKDEGYSGGDLQRPGLDRLREVLRDRDIAVILVHDPDRLARSLSHQLVLSDEFERAGARLEFVTASFEPSPEGRMFFQLKGVFAEYEKEKIKDRTHRGRLQKARSGFVVKGPRIPYGYRYAGKSQNEKGRYLIHAEEATVVREIFRLLVDEQKSIREIVVTLNAVGHRPQRGSAWSKSSVRRILSNPVYQGVFHFNQHRRVNGKIVKRPPTDWIAVPVPAIVSEDLFIRGLEQLRTNSDRLSGRNTHHVYLLRSVVFCGECGGRLAGCPSHGRRYYRCIRRDRLQGDRRCRAGVVSADELERFTWNVICQIIDSPEVLLQKFQHYDKLLESQRHELKEKRQVEQRALEDIERRESRLLDGYVTGTFDRQLIDREAQKLAALKQVCQAEISRIDRKIHASRRRDRDKRLREFCETAQRGIHRLDDCGRQRLFRDLLDEVRINGRTVHIRGVLPGLEYEDPAGSRTGRAVSRTQHQYVAPGLQPSHCQFSLVSDLDAKPSLDSLELISRDSRRS